MSIRPLVAAVCFGSITLATAGELTPLAYHGRVPLGPGVERDVEFRGRLDGDALSGTVEIGKRVVYVVGLRRADGAVSGSVLLKDGSTLGTFDANESGENLAVTYNVGTKQGTVTLPSKALPGLRSTDSAPAASAGAQ